MKTKEIKILFEDSDIIVCVKPSGVPSQSDKSSDYDMVNRLKNYLFEKEPKKGEPYIGLVHRLDRPVGGIMVFGKTPIATKRLCASIQKKEVKKRYLAVLTYCADDRAFKEPELLTDYLVKDGRTNCSCVTNAADKNAKKAELLFQIRQVKEELSLVEVELLTGRHHQIRVQMAAHLGGIWGDTKYNPLFQEKKGFYPIGLYSYRLELIHPITHKKVCFTSYPEEEPFCQFQIKNN